MQTSFTEIDNIFNFKGLWETPSKCGLKIISQTDKKIVIVSELYQDNPGTSVTQAACYLLEQICLQYNLPKDKITYIQHNPKMNSKLSFYEEEFYLVKMKLNGENFIEPEFIKIEKEEIEKFYEKI